MSGTVERARTLTRAVGLEPIRLLRDPLTWRSAAYLLLHWPLALAYFIGLTVLLTVSVGTLIVWVGVLGLVLTMILWRGAAGLERLLTRVAFGEKIPRPYRSLPRAGNPIAKLRTMAADPATWKDLGYLLILFPIGIAEFVVSLMLWSITCWLVTMPVMVAFEQSDLLYFTIGGHTFWVDDPVKALPLVPFGLVLFIVTLYAVRAMAFAHVAIARLLLGPSETQRLRVRTAQLRASRARGVDAAESERRRIERDLHDGAQQRLLAVAMDLGRARAKLRDDPAGARELIQQAHAGAKEAIVELRNLARGIYPAILTDRGLDAAISALAARGEVAVDVEVDLPERPPAAVESIAYFIVAEALTNVTKYARATRASVHIAGDQGWVVVEISDNGVGGAVATPGGGLAGLADRAAGIDGILTVNSPPGGPSVIRADLPCVW